jgi:hypothetical protein
MSGFDIFSDPSVGQHRGYDDEGHKVIVGWVNPDGSEYLIGLTKCCEATGKGCDGYIGCRACYRECSPSLGGQAQLALDVNGVAVNGDG